MLQGATALTFGINTFQTYAQAILLAEDFTPDSMAGWVANGRENREKALIQAFRRIMQCPIGAHYEDQQSMLTQDASFLRSFGPYMLRNQTPAQILALYPPMLADLCRAQVMEADDILSADPVMEARQNGLVSTTNGESSQQFLAVKPLDLPVGSRAMKNLQRWVRFNTRIGRS
jgi:hypothetical protein